MPRELPTGTVTFLFTDVEGSTRLLEELGDRYGSALEEHRRLTRDAVDDHRGVVFGSEGDALFCAFESARNALAAAADIQRAHRSHPDGFRVRIGVHTGEADVISDDYVGMALHATARICSAAHGDQILMSIATRDVLGTGLSDDISIADLGPHRLKDLGPPRNLYQVGHPDLRSDFPPLRTLDARPNNLPVQRTTFIGREDERRDLAKSVPDAPLVTLTGVGGTGKTRLALEVGAELVDDFPDGVWFVDLAPVTDESLVVDAVANPLGVTGASDLAAALVSHLAHRQSLVILDNCEQVITACAELVDRLLGSCPGLRILATSREALAVHGEEVWALDPLPIPDPNLNLQPEVLATLPAVRLFVDRARSAKRGFTLTTENAGDVARICHRLDGVPLALELAAARMRLLSPADLADRMDDRFGLLVSRDRTAVERQRTLRSLIDWSYDLLQDDERVLFRRLSVFVGGFTLDAVPAVCDLAEEDTFDLVAALTDKSLVRVDPTAVPTRFGMLETIRAYAAGKAQEVAETEDLDTRHARWYCDLVSQAAEELRGADQGRWFEALDAAHDNLRKALRWTQDHDPEGLTDLALALVPFWERRGYTTEASQWLEAARELGSGSDTLLAEAGTFARMQGDHERARALLTEAAESDDAVVEAKAFSELGMLALARSAHDEARAHLKKSIEGFRKVEDGEGEAVAIQRMAQVEATVGDYPTARRLLEDTVEALRVDGDPHGLASALSDLGNMAYREGDYDTAREMWRESLETRRELGDRAQIVAPLINLGTVSMATGDLAAAEHFYDDALAVARRTAHARAEQMCLLNLGVLAEEEGRLARARSLMEESLGVARRLGLLVEATGALRGLGRLASATGDDDDARTLLDEALTVARRAGAPFEIVQVLKDLAWVHLNLGSVEDAESVLSEAEQLQEQLGLAQLGAEVRSLQGLLARVRGDLAEAKVLYDASLQTYREHDIKKNVVWQQMLLGDVALASEDRIGAGTHFRGGLRAIEALGPGAEELVEGLAACALDAGDADRAARLLGIAEALRERTETTVPPLFAGTVADTERRTLDALGRSGLEQAWSEGRLMSASRAFEYAVAEAQEAGPTVEEPAPTPTRAAATCLFRQEGDFWSVGSPGDEALLKDTKGMGYIAQLLAGPGRELHVLDMVAALEGHAPATRGPDREMTQASGHAGEFLDDDAKEAYRRRVQDLRAEIEEAEAWGDPERASRAKEELDAIASELAAGVGLGGRDRRAADDAERARGSVSKAIRAALRKITKEHPEIGKRLDACITTGTFCSYTPDPRDPIDWEL